MSKTIRQIFDKIISKYPLDTDVDDITMDDIREMMDYINEKSITPELCNKMLMRLTGGAWVLDDVGTKHNEIYNFQQKLFRLVCRDEKDIHLNSLPRQFGKTGALIAIRDAFLSLGKSVCVLVPRRGMCDIYGSTKDNVYSENMNDIQLYGKKYDVVICDELQKYDYETIKNTVKSSRVIYLKSFDI